jgi:hypothetical protein
MENYEAVPAVAHLPRAVDDFDITIHVNPDPPKAGENAVEVRIKDRTGLPVTDVDVHLLCFMPAMPSMNMPEMRSETRLVHAKDGIYTGVASISMAGRWDVAITARRKGQVVATARAVFSAR